MDRLIEFTNDFLIQENKVPDLSWINVAIAATFLVVNGNIYIYKVKFFVTHRNKKALFQKD